MSFTGNSHPIARRRPCVSRAQPHRTFLTFLNLNGTFSNLESRFLIARRSMAVPPIRKFSHFNDQANNKCSLKIGDFNMRLRESYFEYFLQGKYLFIFKGVSE